jgi:hypothetical protein
VTPEQQSLAALNRLCKWRSFFAGWLLGTRPARDGATRMARDLTDAGLILRTEVAALSRLLGATPPDDAGAELRGLLDMRLTLCAEVSALTALLIERGVITADDLNNQVAIEADYLAAALARRYPGFEATDGGLSMRMPQAAETMRREGFPS